jgi:phosphate transport system substrate-binding protein
MHIIYLDKEADMKKFILITVLSVIFFCIGCKEEDIDNLNSSLIIEGLTVDNYPKVDGSTSTEPLNTIIACKLFDIRYKWVPDYWNLQRIEPNLDNLNNNDADKFLKLIKSSQTHQSFINLINKDADLILTARKMSSDEKTYADIAGVSLIEIPIALDALVFIVNPNNPIKSLTAEQLQDIYTAKITSWNEVGGNNDEIIPYMRNSNSGSQELMEMLVMKNLDITELPVNNDELIIFNMAGAFDAVIYENNAICYTVYYFKEYMVTGVDVKSMAINGIYPDKKTISNNSYPYAAEVYAVIRSDLDESSMAYKLYKWLQTEVGKHVISESGYIPYY